MDNPNKLNNAQHKLGPFQAEQLTKQGPSTATHHQLANSWPNKLTLATSSQHAGDKQSHGRQESCWRQVRKKSTTSSQEVYNKFARSLQQVRKKSTTSSQQVYNKFATSLQQVYNKFTTSLQQAGDRQGHGKQEVVVNRQEVVVNKLGRVTAGKRLLATSLRQVHNEFATSSLQCRDKQATGR